MGVKSRKRFSSYQKLTLTRIVITILCVYYLALRGPEVKIGVVLLRIVNPYTFSLVKTRFTSGPV